MLNPGKYKLHMKIDESIFEQLNHNDMRNVCPSFSFEINMIHSGTKDFDAIELEEIKEITLEGNIKNLGDISLMGIFPHHIPKHLVNNYLDINFNFDQKINHMYEFDKDIFNKLILESKDNNSISYKPQLPNDIENNQGYAVDLRYKITDSGCFKIKLPEQFRNLVKNFDTIEYCAHSNECNCYS